MFVKKSYAYKLNEDITNQIDKTSKDSIKDKKFLNIDFSEKSEFFSFIVQTLKSNGIECFGEKTDITFMDSFVFNETNCKKYLNRFGFHYECNEELGKYHLDVFGCYPKVYTPDDVVIDDEEVWIPEQRYGIITLHLNDYTGFGGNDTDISMYIGLRNDIGGEELNDSKIVGNHNIVFRLDENFESLYGNGRAYIMKKGMNFKPNEQTAMEFIYACNKLKKLFPKWIEVLRDVYGNMNAMETADEASKILTQGFSYQTENKKIDFDVDRRMNEGD